jgi:sporulation protein YlmC with PRC-barrel domain
MAIRIASISDTWEKDVFTDKGVYCGKVKDVECDLKRFKLRSLVVRAVKGSYMSGLLGGKKGLIVPFPMVEAIGDIVIIKHVTPSAEEPEAPAAGESKPSEEA